MKNKKRILFGAVDIGFRIPHYSKFIKELYSDVLEAESFSKYILPQTFYNLKYTYQCPVNKRSKWYVYPYIFWFFIYSLFRFDTFHFLSGEMILTRKLRRLEFKIYKLFGKRVIMHFVGADIRSPKYLEWKKENIKACLTNEIEEPKRTEPFQDRLIRDAEEYADQIIVSTPDLLKIVPKATYIPVFVDYNDVPLIVNKPCKNKIRILFSPSNINTKGGVYIHEILERIRVKYGNEIELIIPGYKLEDKLGKRNGLLLTRFEMLKEMESADIVIDQMLIGWYGLKSIEALTKCCEVICYIDEDLLEYVYPDCPIINANINTLEDKLSELIDKMKFHNYQRPDKTAWLKEYHSIEKYGNLLKEIWGLTPDCA